MKTYAVPSSNEIAQTVQVMTKETDVIYIPTDNTIANAMQTVVGEANRTKTPIIPSVDTMVEQGGLATVGINQHALGYKPAKWQQRFCLEKVNQQLHPFIPLIQATQLSMKNKLKVRNYDSRRVSKKSKLIN